jgi:hypothetical protein
MQALTDCGLQKGAPRVPHAPTPAEPDLDAALERMAGEAADLIASEVSDLPARALVAKNFAAMVALALLDRRGRAAR